MLIIAALIIVIASTTLSTVFYIKSRNKVTSDWMINCAPTDTSPLISDAQAAIAELATMPAENCRARALSRTTTILCHGTACISRFEPIMEHRLKEISSFKEHPKSEPTCMLWASWLNKTIAKSECRSPDGLRAEGRIIMGNEGQNVPDVRLFSIATLT
ncbi:hypothetical protein DFP73DRAFT_592387 [Morchella snyderi]|nr:hypothetical protein DFP73DRAFT_592387 [Morchella snyderi]